MQETEIEKQSRLNKLALDASGEVMGYRFQKDSIANQMAYCFGGPEGEKAAEEIRVAAENKYPDPIAMPERKQFIEEEIRKRSQDVDTKFQKGIMDIFSRLSKNGVAASGEEAEKDAIVSLMQSLGLNVHKDNVQANYDPGPPQCLVICWINRPTENLANKDSNVNKLADFYTNNCDETKTKKFEGSWDQHIHHAETGGPKMDTKEFLDASEESFKSFKGTVEQGKKGPPMTALVPMEPLSPKAEPIDSPGNRHRP